MCQHGDIASPSTWAAFRADYQRLTRLGWKAFAEPSIWAIATYRFGQSINKLPCAICRKLIRILYSPFATVVMLLTGIYLPPSCQIGGGLRIWHFGGVMIHPLTIIGSNCTLRHGVTIGNRVRGDDVPILGNDVQIGAGAKILGAIRIGNGARIGANAVVVTDVPDHHLAVGIPAVAKPIREQVSERCEMLKQSKTGSSLGSRKPRTEDYGDSSVS